LDPNRDINWSFHPPAEGKKLLSEGKIDGYLGFPPDPQELRDRKIGRMLLSSTVDRPWSQYYCCMPAVNRSWARKHPVATKRVLRAILKGSELCASDPEAGVKAYLAKGYSPKPEYALQALRELPYRSWRDFNPEDTLRFYALQLREAGMIKNTPQKIIAQGTDFRIFNELKREMKA
jgi:NitT/TauT family transport system substrate-binding protein